MTKTVIMNKKNQYGKIVEECIKGNFEEALHFITQNDGNLNSKIALKILISCANACARNKENISECLLLKMLRNLLPLLKDLNESESLSYVYSLYHFVQFFVYKGTLDIIFQIEDIIIPKFLSPKVSEKHTDIYLIIAKILHNLVVKCAMESELLYRISMLMLQICERFLVFTKTANLFLNCFKSFTSAKVSVDYQIEYYKAVLKIAKTCTESKHEVVTIVFYFSCGIFHNIFSTYDFEKGLNFLNNTDAHLKTILNCMECVDLHQVLRIFVLLSPLKLQNKEAELIKCEKNFKNLDNLWQKFECRLEFNQYLSRLLHILKNYYSNVNPKGWSICSEDMQLHLFKMIVEFDSFLVSQNTKGNLLENIATGFSYARILSSLIKNTIQNGGGDLKYHQLCIRFLDTFFKQIEVLKNQNSNNWRIAWNALATEMRTIALLLHQNSDQASWPYLFLIIQYFIRLEFRSGTTELKCNFLQSVCATLIEIHSKDSKKCLAFISLSTLLCVNNREYFMSKWITLKHTIRENKSVDSDDIQKITLVSALQLLETELPEIQLENSDKVLLLKLELNQYKKKWKSKVCILSAMQELRKVCDIHDQVNVIIKIFIDVDLPNHEEIYDMILDVLKIYKQSTESTQINLAILYYICYKACNKKMISKNAEDMERVASLVPANETPDTIEHNGESDIVSSFECLNIDVHKEQLEMLQLSLNTFTSLVPLLSTDNYEHVTFTQMFNVLQDIHSQYKLLCFKLKAVQALQLALKIAQLLNDTPNIIKTIGFIIEQEDCKKECIQQLITTADGLLADESFSKSDHLELCIVYYICKSSTLLFNDYEDSYKALIKAEDLFEQMGENNRLVKCQLLLLNSKFNLMPCNLREDVHKKSLLLNTYSATEIMYQEHNECKLDTPYKLMLFIEACTELVKLHHYLRCPREVRTYAKSVLTLMQKLILPLQVVTYLTYVAHADLNLNKHDSCCVNIGNITDILNIETTSPRPGADAVYLKQSSPSSPTLRVSSFQMPCAIHHSDSCECYYCACYEYQASVFEQARLSALLNIKQNNIRLAQNYFEGALKLYDYYAQKYSKNGKLLVPDFLPSYGYILLDYSSHLWRTDCEPEARNFNSRLLSLLDDKKLQNIHLYNKALIQKFGYLTANMITQSTPGIRDEIDDLKIPDNTDLSRTPENKQSKVTVTVKTPEFISPQISNLIKYHFTLSPVEPPPGGIVKKPIDKTPAPKINIFIDGPNVRHKRRPNTNVLVPTPATENLPSFKSAISLKPRTRLLTEKLKMSMKKTEPSTSDVENHAQTSAGSRRNITRKNLLKEMSTPSVEQKDVGKGAVRRSSKKRS